MVDIDFTTPKAVIPTAYGIPIRNLWYMLLYAWNESPNSPYWQLTDVEESPSLDALLASILVETLQSRLRIGLGCNYIAEQQLIRRLRGRIHFTKSLKQRAFEQGKAFCEYEQFSVNAPKNQIIRSTLFNLAREGQFGTDKAKAEKLRHNIRWLVRTLDGIDLIDLSPDFIHRQQAARHDRDYRIMIAVCDLLIQRRMPTEDEGQIYMSQMERDRFILHNVFERFVYRFYSYHLSDWDVKYQKKLVWHEDTPNQYLPNMKPDIFLQERSNDCIIVLDTKFTSKSLIKNQWGKEMLDSSHLYQIYAYLRTQEHISERYRQAVGILLYPTVKDELSETVDLPNHQIRIECVDLAAPWQAIENRLLDIIIK